MQNDDTMSPLTAVEEMERSAGAVEAAISDFTKPSESTQVIETLERTQQVIARTYAGLAKWHAAAEVGVHHAGEQEPVDLQNPGWVRAQVALEEAAQYASDAASALERARMANMTARWFDEIRSDGV